MPTDRIYPEEMYTFNTATLTGNYDLATDPGFLHSLVILRVINDSNRDVYISYDGVHDHDYVPNLESLQLNFQTNSGPNNEKASLATGTRIYLKGLAGGTGNVYLGGYYLE